MQLKLEELQLHAAIKGTLPDQLVMVIHINPYGSDAIELTCKMADGQLQSTYEIKKAPTFFIS